MENNALEIQLLWEVCRRVLRGSRAVRIRCLRIQWADFFPCPGFSPDSLVQLEQECVSVRHRRRYFASSASVRVAHLPQNPVIDSFFHFCVYFSLRNDKKTAVSQAARIHHMHLVFIHGCFHVFDKYQPKSAAERASCRCNRKILLSAYLFALMYASAPEKFLHPSDNSSPVSSLKRITVACQSGSLTPLPLVILVH